MSQSVPGDLDTALNEVPQKGFSPALVEAWSKAVDAAMTARLAALDLPSLPVRTRIRTAVLTRLELLAPRKELARQAALFLARPDCAALAIRLSMQNAGAMWHAAGDTATDFNWYSKRAILAAVYAATEIAWFGDDSAGGAATARFLDSRIENVMQFERLKARFRDLKQQT